MILSICGPYTNCHLISLSDYGSRHVMEEIPKVWKAYLYIDLMVSMTVMQTYDSYMEESQAYRSYYYNLNYYS